MDGESAAGAGAGAETSMLVVAHPDVCPPTPVVGSAADYVPVVQLLMQEAPVPGASWRNVMDLVMLQAADWHRRDSTAVPMGRLLALAEQDLDALQGAVGRMTDQAGVVYWPDDATERAWARVVELLRELDHGPLQIALLVRDGAPPATWDDPRIVDLFVHPRRPRTAAFVEAAAPRDWRVTAAWSGVSVPGGERVRFESMPSTHPAVVALERRAPDTARRWAERTALTHTDRSQALGAVAAWALCRHADRRGISRERPDDTADSLVAWAEALVADGADPNTPMAAVCGSDLHRTVGAPVPDLMVDRSTLRDVTRGVDAWEAGANGTLHRTKPTARSVVVRPSDLALMALPMAVDLPSDLLDRWCAAWTAAWTRHGGPQPGGLFPNSVTALLHAAAPVLHQGAAVEKIVRAWLPVCVAADRAQGVAWWEHGPTAQQPWDAWGVAAAMAVRAEDARPAVPPLPPSAGRPDPTRAVRSMHLVHALLDHLPPEVDLPEEAVHRLVGLLAQTVPVGVGVRSVTEASVAGVVASVEGRPHRVAVALPSEPGTGLVVREITLWAPSLEVLVRHAAARVGADRRPAVDAFVDRALDTIRSLARSELAARPSSQRGDIRKTLQALSPGLLDRLDLLWAARADPMKTAARVGRSM